LLAAANRVLRGEIAARARRLMASRDDAFRLEPDATVSWGGGAVARLVAGETVLAPRAELLPGEFLEGELREGVRRRIAAFVREEIRRALKPLFRLAEAPLGGAARGLAFQLAEALGAVAASEVAAQRFALGAPDRKELARFGVRLGTEAVYLDKLLKPGAVAMRALLWAVQRGAALAPPLPPPGRVSLPVDPAAPPGFYAAIGYAALGSRALRLDRVERLAAAARRQARQGAFAATVELAGLAGCSVEELPELLTALGYRAVVEESGTTFHARPRRRGKKDGAAQRRAPIEGPFAALGSLKLAR
jgi:ATP-dependent RNA helicase SUPV3L1/SUV3